MAGLREQFIERLMREFFLRSGSGFVLKGGGAIQALFGAQRLTKDIDLDFTNPRRTANSLHNSVKRAIEGAARGLPCVDLAVSTPGKSERSPRWKINFKTTAAEDIHIDVEVSRDPDRAPPGKTVQKAFVPESAVGIARFWVDIYDQPTLIATKIAALLGRDAPRDVYDLDLLTAGAERPSPKLIRWSIDRAGVSRINAAETVRGRLEGFTWERFCTELRDSLPDHIAARIDQAEWSSMKMRVGSYVEDLLRDDNGERP